MDSVFTKVSLDNNFGFIDSSENSSQVYNPRLVDNIGSNTMIKCIRDELRRANTFVFSVAFISPSAVSLLKQPIIDFQGRGTIVTSTYLGFNSPEAFREILALPNVDIRVVDDPGVGFHAKGYVFEHESTYTAIVGSSNLTANALVKNREWNLRFSALPDGDIVDQLQVAIDGQLGSSVPLTGEWIDQYEKEYVRAPVVAPEGVTKSPIIANGMQRDALREIQKYRDAGEIRAVVVSATGTGKTILAALDVKAFNPRKMLFIVHREQILDRAIEEFQRILADEPSGNFGKLVGNTRQSDRKYVFSTIQSISKPATLQSIDPEEFDYVLIDEVHRAGADSYRRVIEYLQPKFLLGVTATPERTDGFNLYQLFDFNVPYEIRLNDALENDMLAPFHYFGVTDYEVDGEVQYGDNVRDLARLVMPERVDHIVRSLELYGQRGVDIRGLIFCSRNAEADELSLRLNERLLDGRKLRTLAISGSMPVEGRESLVRDLEGGHLDYLITVDVFNEGIDIPSVNQIVMLRQTQSSIVFTQQLGRGLRKSNGKDYVVVIDFIGNYANNYLIPIAIFGDSSLDSDQVKKRIIDSDDAGVIQGVSSVNFDQISRQRVLDSISAVKLDGVANLKKAVVLLRDRLGRLPYLVDFARFDSVDPVVIATHAGDLWSTLVKLKFVEDAPSVNESDVLRFLTEELLNGKRLHELILLELLYDRISVSADEYRLALVSAGCISDEATISSVLRVLSLEFFTQAERAKYGNRAIVESNGVSYRLSAHVRSLTQGDDFNRFYRDVIQAGIFLGRHRYDWTKKLTIGQRYSRKDFCRLMNWSSNHYSTIYGYKVDYETSTFPVFITFHKSDEVAESTRYEDEFLNESTIRWFTKSNRTLRSPEIRAIEDERIQMSVFGKKDDAEGKEFFYLGDVEPSNLEQQKMPGTNNSELDVVTMNLTTESPIELSLYDYLRGATE